MWLAGRGYVLVARDLRVGRNEVDLLAWDGATLVLVEVRARRRGAMVSPLESVTAAKRRRLRDAALRLAQDHGTQDVRIDVVAVVDGAVSDHVVGAIDFSEG